jgi:hypothetical protein
MADLMKWCDTRRSPVDVLERLFEGDTSATGIRVEESVEGNTLVVRAEVPGVDPDKDVSVSTAAWKSRLSAVRSRSRKTRTATGRSSVTVHSSVGWPCLRVCSRKTSRHHTKTECLRCGHPYRQQPSKGPPKRSK